MSYRNVWIATINSAFSSAGVPGTLINVKFRGREVADFPRRAFDDLKDDPAVEWITDDETGEILFPLD